jgi:SAM-dependent methyltransferase
VIDASFYDADYFNGITSNYHGGYTWEILGELFRAQADMLIASFPEAKTYLDVGCAKGLLVEALRERGLEAYGIDHSAYAIGEADACVRPYLSCVPLETLGKACPFVDIVVASEVLEHLEPWQLKACLPILAKHANIGLFATVPMPSMSHRGAWRAAQQEPSHVTLEDRPWWHALLQSCGWRVGCMERLVERYFINHPLFLHMGWCPLIASTYA